MKIISPFLQSDPTQRLIFFDFPCSILHFHQNILPSLKVSLSLTLTHFLPIAGNVVLPLNSGTPAIRCASGDSVSLIIAQSDQNLHYLTSHNQRIADHFYECVPELPLATRFVDSVVFPVIALQITLFAGQGICIGITNHHAVADGSSIVNFVKSWGCANRSGDGEAFHQAVVQNLKNHVYANTPNSCDVSSLTVISAYAWICALRSAVSSDDEEKIVYFSFAADCRGGLNPPLPESYFGNCLVFVRAGARRGSLKKEGGFLTAVESIREATRRILHSDRGVMESADWPLDFRKNTDFGWAKPRQQEFVHLDWQRSISLCKSRDFEGAFEIGLSRNKAEMDIFERVFGDPNLALEAFKFTSSSAMPPAIQIHNLPERILLLLPLAAEEPSNAGAHEGGKWPEIRRVAAGEELVFAIAQRLEAGLDLLALIGETVHRRHSGLRPHSVRVTHLCVFV
ncbi:hypothetical protein SASPL_152159 [Salvia splendens]|uniref:Uncharacterized protein n=1 Tax=Salvia splendens TaxID=180675 RepID=A0A8X8W2L4_SALSN|nr:hypothetical protein SASPL_152159 [Salvia splendens]